MKIPGGHKNTVNFTFCDLLCFDLHVQILIRQKKKIVMLPSPDQNLKIGSVGRFFSFFFFF